MEAGALNALILAEPDDDGPRRVYADWLTERGDPRGEFILVQCELARIGGGDRRRDLLRRREGDLLRAHGRPWLEELGFGPLARVRVADSSGRCPPGQVRARRPRGHIPSPREGSFVVFRRGFADEAKLDLGSFLGAADPALAASTLRRLVLTDITARSAPQLAQLEVLERSPVLTSLCLRRLNLDADLFSTLARAPLLRGVTELELQRARIRGDLTPLAQASQLQGLRRLRLDRTTTVQGLEVVARGAPELTHLELDHCWVAGELWRLFRGGEWPSLQHLLIRNGGVDDAVVGAIASSKRPLAHLDLIEQRFGDEGAESLVRSRRLAKLRSLRLSARRLSAGSIVALRKRFGPRLDLQG